MHCFGIGNKKLVFLDSPTVSKERERIDGQFVYTLRQSLRLADLL